MSNIYDMYFTGSDVTIDFVYGNSQVTIDKAVGIGFKHSISTMPVYGLGSSIPAFFSRGNSLVSGQLDLAFKTNKYISTGLNYLFGIDDSNKRDSRLSELKAKFSKSPKSMSTKEIEEYSSLNAEYAYLNTTESILSIPKLFDIHINISNANALRDDELKTIIIKGVRFNEQSFTAHSADEGILVDRYSFIAKTIQ